MSFMLLSHNYVMTAWEMLTAAMVTTAAARNVLIDAIYAFSSSGLNHYAYADWFDTTTGVVEGNCGGAATQCDRARPIAGAHLALVGAFCCRSVGESDADVSCGPQLVVAQSEVLDMNVNSELSLN